jgi:hypothetical protein
MSYFEAKDMFQDNLKILGKPEGIEQELIWNLSIGLQKLTEALEADSAHIRNVLGRLSQSRQR